MDTNEFSEYTSSETFALLQKYAKEHHLYMSVGTGTIVDGVDHLVGFVYADDTYPFIDKKYIQENKLPDYSDN